MKAKRAIRLTVKAPGAATLLAAMRHCDQKTSTTIQRGLEVWGLKRRMFSGIW